MDFKYDIIVIGAGHAGCEAAVAAANLGSKTLLITMDMNKIAQMSCNPAVGGIAKGQIVREIDALGGQMGIVTDKTAIQFRMLNRSKGPAMWSPRSQSDRKHFIDEWIKIVSNTENLYLWQDTVKQFILENEGYDRDYYSGFLGELNIDLVTFKTQQSDLFVNLRCMKINNSKAQLFIGCGITEHSIPHDEYIETVNKSMTMKKIL